MGHRHHVRPEELESLVDYRRRTLSAIGPLSPIEETLEEAHGTVLATEVAAPHNIPPFNNSAMDGFAVRAADAVDGARLRIIGEVAAGSASYGTVGEGEAIRIMTGAPIPRGATAVVPVEVVDEDDGRVTVNVTAMEGENVRSAGESVTAGETVLQPGQLLDAAAIGMLAAMGIARVTVHPKPRVAVLATGDELVQPGKPLQPGQIHESNSYLLAAQVTEAGAIPFRQPVARDDERALRRAFEGALAHADLLVTSGGVSAGLYDLSKKVLAEMGDVTFSKVGMQPGMPQAFGTIDGIPVFGLPGNPVSTAVSFEVHVRPAIRRMQGQGELNRPRLTAVLAEPVRSPPHKVSFLRVTLARTDNGWAASTTGAQGSGILRSMVLADGLAEIPADVTELDAGQPVTVHVLGPPTS